MPSPIVYLIPSFLHENGTDVMPAYVLPAVKDCQVFFVEDERSARRYLKLLWKEMVIDDYQWVTIHKAEEGVRSQLRNYLKQGKNIGIISEAGCPGVADPGQLLVEVAHGVKAVVKPLVGPSAILLALMGSGMNGQRFQFMGYLPIDTGARIKAIRDLEVESSRKQCTQLFIETPYRNNQMLETLLKTLSPATRVCVATDLTAPTEFIETRTVLEWKKQVPDLHKRPTIFCVLGEGRQ